MGDSLSHLDNLLYIDLAKPKSGALGLFILTGLVKVKGFGIIRVLVFPVTA